MRRLLILLMLFASLANAQSGKYIIQKTYTASGTNTYTATIPGFIGYGDGIEVKIKFTNANTGAATINISDGTTSLGAKTLQKNGAALSSGDISANGTYRLTYDGTNFQVLGLSSGGGGASLPISDGINHFKNSTDATKLGQFDLSVLFTGTTSVISWPTSSGTMARLSDIPDPLLNGNDTYLTATTRLLGNGGKIFNIGGARNALNGDEISRFTLYTNFPTIGPTSYLGLESTSTGWESFWSDAYTSGNANRIKFRLGGYSGTGVTTLNNTLQLYAGFDTDANLNNPSASAYIFGVGTGGAQIKGGLTVNGITTGYVKSASGALGAVTSIPNTDISGLGTMSIQNASSVAITGGTINSLTGFSLLNSGAGAFVMSQSHNGTLTTGRSLTWNLNDAARTISLSGNLTVSGAATVSGTNTGDGVSTVSATVPNGLSVSVTNPTTTPAIAITNTAIQSITTGTATTVSAGTQRVLINPASLLASHTVTMPASPNDGDRVIVNCGGTITAGNTVVTTFAFAANTGQSLLHGITPTTAKSGDTFEYVYYSSLTTWIRQF